jgi:tetrahydromethanopterin S-methyltransferase subunit F
VDGAVRLVAGGVVRSAAGSSAADDRGVDGAVEGIAAAVGVSGRATRRLQTGLAHTYYLYLAIGAVAIAVVVAFWR